MQQGGPSLPLPSPRLPRPLLPCIHCRSGPRFSSPRHTSFEGRRTSLSRTLKAGARFDQPAVPRCCPHFYPNNINKPPETRSRGQQRPPRSPGPDPGRFRLWPRLGAVGRGGCHTLQRKVAPKRCEYLGDATLGPSQDCMCSGPSGPVAVATERPGARRMALTSPGADALAHQEDPEASDLPQGGRYQGEVTCVTPFPGRGSRPQGASCPGHETAQQRGRGMEPNRPAPPGRTTPSSLESCPRPALSFSGVPNPFFGSSCRPHTLAAKANESPKETPSALVTPALWGTSGKVSVPQIRERSLYAK